MTTSGLPLDGMLVVSVEQAVAAPLATRHLADLGARVIKIERPDGGDFARRYDTAVKGLSAYFVWINRTKESVALDIAEPRGRAVLDRLIERADVVVQNLSPGSAGRLGIDPQTLHAKYPRLVACGITGFGTRGPMAGRKAYDLLLQGEVGLLEVTGTPAERVKTGISIADIAAGMYAYSSVLAALLRRQRSGEGAPIEVAMIDALAEWTSMPLYYAAYGGTSPRRTGAAHATIAPYGPFRVADGEVLLAVQHDREWQRLCRTALRRPDLADDPRFATNVERVANRDALEAAIEEITAELPAADLIDRLAEADIAYARVNTLDEVWQHPQLRQRGRFATVSTPAGPIELLRPPAEIGPGAVMGPVPELGEHTDAVLAELGLSPAEFHELKEARIVGC